MSKSHVQHNADEKKKKVEKRKRGNVKLNIPTHLEHSSDGRYYFG